MKLPCVDWLFVTDVSAYLADSLQGGVNITA